MRQQCRVIVRPHMIEQFIKLIPDSLNSRSGSVFYSGRDAFDGSKDLYILGVNPGGSPNGREDESVKWHTEKVLSEPNNWSAYRDESWLGSLPGTRGMQPRVLHLFSKIDCSAGTVPASNIVFVRSSREVNLEGNMQEMAELCWPFHDSVINELSPKVILCFGQTAGNFICRKLAAYQQIDEFVEQNNRRWCSRTFANNRGLKVVVATHPSIANWVNPVTDPTVLVERALRREA